LLVGKSENPTPTAISRNPAVEAKTKLPNAKARSQQDNLNSCGVYGAGCRMEIMFFDRYLASLETTWFAVEQPITVYSLC
jgi:hypothetical protein